ncbi:MAG: ABC transporter ATP-binding protein [Candidatus Nealsonbacteria bacterium]|nr:ABC transporter ATP-binding protein [Candidatus Nealsonbacteria bacterium]
MSDSTATTIDTADSLLRAERVSKLYTDGQVHALREVSIEIARGEYIAVMGPSGSGKSTLLNVLGALDRPTEGEVYFEGQPLSAVKSLDRYRSEKLGFVFQSFHLLSVLTAVENVQIPMFETDLSAGGRVKKARELLETVGMAHRAAHQPKQLSVGERQRVALARALANDPQLLLADEPTGNLDSVSAAGIMDLFDRLHHDRGVTIVMVTHDAELAGRTGRTIHMQDGRVVA